MAKKTTTKVVSDTKVVKNPKTTTTKKRVSRKKVVESAEPTDVVPEAKLLFSGTSGSVGNMMFSNVSSISTPYGNVTKITRKSDGKVLWEKQ